MNTYHRHTPDTIAEEMGIIEMRETLSLLTVIESHGARYMELGTDVILNLPPNVVDDGKPLRHLKAQDIILALANKINSWVLTETEAFLDGDTDNKFARDVIREVGSHWRVSYMEVAGRIFRNVCEAARIEVDWEGF